MESAILGILIFLVILVILPIISLITTRQIKEETRMLSMQLFSVIKRIEILTQLANEIKEEQSKVNKQTTVVTEPVIDEIAVESTQVDTSPVETYEEEPIIEIPQQEVITPEETPEPEPVVVEITTVEENIPETEVNAVEPAAYVAEEKATSLLNQLWGENLLSKIGIVTFVLGIAFFVKYAIDKEWINEIGRVGIGLLIGMAIIGVGHKLRKQYEVFSSILAGGGFAVFYITITLAFLEYELIPQTAAFALLVLVTIACVILSVFYDKKELALFALLGGFAAPFLVSTGSGNYMVLFSYLLILNSGMLWLAFRKKWDIISIVCFVFTQLIVWIWLIGSFKGEFAGAALFLLLFFIQFHTVAIADHLKKGVKIAPFQALVILWNNISLFAGWIHIFLDYPAEVNGILAISIAILNAVALIIVFRNGRTDQNMIYLLIATILTFITLAIPLQLKGNVITLFWTAEIVVLLVLWMRSQIRIFRFGLYGVIALTIISYGLDLSQGYIFYESFLLPVLLNKYFITGITLVVACIMAGFLLKKELGKEILPDETELTKQNLQPLFNFFLIATYILLFVVLYTELNYQLTHRIIYSGAEAFRLTVVLTYIVTYAAIAIFLNRIRLAKNDAGPMLVLGIIAAYAVIYFFPVTELREAAYPEQTIPVSYFAIHLLSLIPAGYLIFQMWKFTQNTEIVRRTRYAWILVIAVIVIITRESDNIAILFAGKNAVYYSVLHDVHTFGYPVLWGLLAMTLMIWGLKAKDSILRKIALVFFAFIIFKFYIYDVWRMSQGGRIISFVLLGLILLVVSFMQQKIRKLVQNDKEEEVK